MNKFEEMSDFDINKLIHIKRCRWGAGFYDRVIGKIFPHKEPTEEDIYKAGIIVDYCSSWADMGSIIESERINVVANQSAWVARKGFYDARHTNPLRAAAIIYLELLGENND